AAEGAASPLGVVAPGSGTKRVGIEMLPGADLRLAPVDAREQRLGQRLRLEATRRDARRRLARPEIRQIHARLSPLQPRSDIHIKEPPVHLSAVIPDVAKPRSGIRSQAT